MIDSPDDAFTERMLEIARNPATANLACELLSPEETARAEAAYFDRLQRIHRRVMRSVQRDTVLHRLRTQGLRLVESVGETARVTAAWFEEVLLDLAALRRATSYAGHYGNGDDELTVIIEPRRGLEHRLRAELAEPMVWQQKGILRVVLRVEGDLCQVPGWAEAGLLLRLPQNHASYLSWPTIAKHQGKVCTLEYEVPFAKGHGDPRGTVVPLEAIEEIRLLPLPL